MPLRELAAAAVALCLMLAAACAPGGTGPKSAAEGAGGAVSRTDGSPTSAPPSAAPESPQPASVAPVRAPADPGRDRDADRHARDRPARDQ